MNALQDRKIAILVEDGFEEVELSDPRRALDDEGALTEIVSPRAHEVRAWASTDWGDRYAVDVALAEADADRYDALLLPGGVINPDHLRRNPAALQFVRAFIEAGKPIAAICHGPQTLIEVDGVRDRTVTSFPSIRTDLVNAGAVWVDEEVVVDHGLVTSRSPDDLPAFNRAMIEEFAEGRHAAPRSGRGSSRR